MKLVANLALIAAVLLPGAALAEKAPKHFVPWTLVVDAHGKKASILMASEQVCTDTARQELAFNIRRDLGASASCFNPYTGEVEIFNLQRFPELIHDYKPNLPGIVKPNATTHQIKPWRFHDRIHAGAPIKKIDNKTAQKDADLNDKKEPQQVNKALSSTDFDPTDQGKKWPDKNDKIRTFEHTEKK